MTEPGAGSDLQAVRTWAVRDRDHYVVNGAKTFITNGYTGNLLAVVVKTDPRLGAKGISLIAMETEGLAGFRVGRVLEKIGNAASDTCELFFDDVRVPAENLIGGVENEGFKQVMTGLEAERINVAARGLGIARAAFEEAIRYAQRRTTFGKPIAEHQTIQIKLADMATKIEASRLLIYSAAEKKDRGERCDLEAGMAKLFATETAAEVSLEAMRILGGNGYSKDFPVERYYRDAPLVVIGGGTNELQRLIIARNLLKKYRESP
jgi:alkylation response protein AidB-like acyl-CoA dehydrogenase